MFDFYSPITYNTDVNSLVFNYYTGVTQGNQPYYENPWSEFNINSLYTLGNGFFQPYQNYGYNGWNIFQNPNWCNWQGNSGNTWNYYSSGSTFNIFKFGQNQYDSRSYTTNPVKKASQPTKPVEKNQQVESKKNTEKTSLNENFVTNAKKYMGLNEADGSWKKISNHPEWCADFIYHVIDESYKEQGKAIPKGLEKQLPPDRKNHRVEDLKQWGIDNGKFFQTANKSNKGKIIAENVRPGDILILREDGASHTGFVTKVYNDGTFETIEGNRNDKVCTAKYSPNYHEISGFVQLS